MEVSRIRAGLILLVCLCAFFALCQVFAPRAFHSANQVSHRERDQKMALHALLLWDGKIQDYFSLCTNPLIFLIVKISM